ncbi:MAG TPA: KH domain-containing protein [Candidatus Bathyarchaeia archaeon]|nr:KH domain-containing protein [Candidatus Bathyarchaeia archaeon]
MMTQHVKIPQDRIGVLIGHNGFVKDDIEKKSESTITVDSNEGEVRIEGIEGGDPVKTLRVAEVVKAIGRGFSPESVLKLLDDDLLLFEVISLSHLSQKTLNRVKGRVIGRNGKTRRTIENLADVKISVYGKTISLIGYAYQIRTAHEAIARLIHGAHHSSVYRFLERKRRAEGEW